MKKVISFLYLLLIINLAALSQQDPQYTNNMYYKLGVNPGFAGAEDAINGLILNRYQWVGMTGAPKTLVFSVDAAVNMFGSSGLGLNIISDELGFEKNITINASYAYKTSLSFGDLGIGFSAGLLNKGFNTGDDRWRTSSDVLQSTSGSDDIGGNTGSGGGGGDGIAPTGEVSQMAFDGGFGLYLLTKQYYFGLSVTHINKPEIRFDEQVTTFLERHYYLMGGYNIKLTDPLFELRPSFLFKSDLAGWQIDLNTNVVYNERFWGGISYRVNDAIALLMGLEMENGLRIGYSFDLVTSAIGRYGYGSHEIFIGYSLNLERNRNQKYKSVRFL